MKKNAFRSIYILFLVLALMQFLFCMITLFLVTQPDSFSTGKDLAYPYLPPLIIVLVGGAAWFMNNLRSQSLPINAILSTKIMHYRVSVILRAAIVEGGNLFCLTLALLENDTLPVLYFVIGMLVFLYFRPKLDEFTSLYRISGSERNALQESLKRKQR